jgi:hypothetical protein
VDQHLPSPAENVSPACGMWALPKVCHRYGDERERKYNPSNKPFQAFAPRKREKVFLLLFLQKKKFFL